MVEFQTRPDIDANADAVSPAPSHDHEAEPPMGVPLTPREGLVLDLIREGLSTRQAAKRLNVRPRTVEKHVERALRKLGARSRIEALAILRTRAPIGKHAGHANRPADARE